jgi:hypothetical protein
MITKLLNLRITKFLGKGTPYNTISNSILFSIVLFIYILDIGSFFKPIVYPLIHRVTYSTLFINKFFIDANYDFIIISFATAFWFLFAISGKFKYISSSICVILTCLALLVNEPILFSILSLSTLPLMLIFIIFNKINKSKIILFNKQICVNYISVFGILLAILSINISILSIIQPQLSLPPINYLYYIFLLSSIFSPILLVIISLYYPCRWIINNLIKRELLNRNENKRIVSSSNKFIKLNIRIISLLGIISLSIIITLIPHLSTINPDNQIIGGDSKYYVNFLTPMNNSSSIQEFLHTFILQLQGDRPLSLVIFYFFSHLLNSSNLTNSIEILPLVLGPLLIITTYFLTMELTSNHGTSLLSAFLTVTSFPILIGIYGGLYANWFSMIFGYLAILFLIRSLNKPTKSNFIIFSTLMIIVLLTHEPTWPILSIVFSIFLVIMLYLNPLIKKYIIYLFLSLLPSFILELFRTIFTNNSGLVRDVSFAGSQGAGLHDIFTIGNNLIATTHTYLGGQFGNPIILILVIYWFFVLDIKKKSNILLIIFLSITILPILFGDTVIQCRVLYEIPFQIPAAMALTQLKKNNGNTLILSICLVVMIIAIRTVSNFYFISHL